MDHLVLRTAYDGTNFHGFQLQTDKVSVQSFFEASWKKLYRQNIRIKFFSRTDAGVHAYDQWVVVPEGMSFFESLSLKKKNSLRLSMNALLRGRVVIWQLRSLKSQFDPTKDILWKEYRYRVFNSPVWDPTLDSKRKWIRPPLDIEAMRAEAASFMGRHDFASFAKSSGRDPLKSTVRSIHLARIDVKPHTRMDSAQNIEFVFRGSGFLHNMVRNMVGTLVDVGLGKNLKVSKLLKLRDRSSAGRGIPPEGLILTKTKLREGLSAPLHYPQKS